MTDVTSVTAGSSGESVTQASTGPAASTGQAASSAGSTGAYTSSTAGSTGSVQITWPDNWRQELSAGDDKRLKRFERYASVKDLANALISAQDLIASGELKKALPKDATPEQVAAWRKENGIPEKPEGYEIKLKNGAAVAAEDKPLVDALLKTAHGQNLNSAQVSAIIDWFGEQSSAQADAEAEADKKVALDTTNALRAEWGADYPTNMNLVDSLLLGLPNEDGANLRKARLGDGKPLMASIPGLKALAHWARQINPVASVVPNAAGNVAGAIDDEIKQIEGWMGAPAGTQEYKKYWDNEKTQARLRELYDARTRIQGAPRG